MNTVPRRTRVSRTTWKKLPNGAPYYVGSNSAGVFMKAGGPHNKFQTNVTPQTDPALVNMPDNTIEVIRIDRFFFRQQS